MNNRYELTVIGGGPGGYVAAIRAAQLGLKVAVIEEKEMGGTCLNRGCIPTKALLHGAEVFQTVRTCGKYGIETGQIAFDFGRMAAHKDSIVKKLRTGVETLVKSNGVDIIRGKAYIKDKNTIEITERDKQSIHTGKIIIATGSRPTRPPVPGIDGSGVLDSDQVLALTSCPKRIVIIGGGVIGMEFATLFNSLGKDVTILEVADTILPGMDVEISSLLAKSMEKKGVRIFTDARVASIKSDSQAICVFTRDNTEMEAAGDIVIVAAGRRPNTEGIGLENAGLAVEHGYIKVDDRMETSVKGIYAIGDVTGKMQLAHVASAQGMAAAANAAGKTVLMNYQAIPSCIYTNPEIASIGLSEADALKNGKGIKIGRFPVGFNGRSMIIGETDGLVKITTDEANGEILGAQIMAPRATDMIAEMCVSMKLESTIEELAGTIHPHPTVSEIIMEAAHDREGLCVHKPAR